MFVFYLKRFLSLILFIYKATQIYVYYFYKLKKYQ